jgi:hypothetical protein
MRFARCTASWIAALMILGCRGRDSGFMPLKDGLRLVYDVEYVTGLGGIGNVQRAEAIQRIDGTKKINGHEYFRVMLVVTGMPGWEPEVIYQRMAEDGLHEVRYVEGKPVEYLLLPIPLKVGQSWQTDMAKINVTCRVEAQEPAILPEKTYEDAYKVSCSGSRGPLIFKNYTYVVAGVGNVKFFQEAGAQRMEMRLREGNQG